MFSTRVEELAMAEVLLFHHVQGLTDGVLEFAEALRNWGHTVHTPDLFNGNTFDSIDAGSAYVDSVGFDVLLQRGMASAEPLSPELVYVGFSFGVVPAQALAQTRAGCRAAVLIEACIPVSEFGSWPSGVPVQIHGMADDPFFGGEGDIDSARDLVRIASSHANAELFLYEGDRHLFSDSSLDSFDPIASAELRARLHQFLADL
jgi:dienelactone hydrolase